MRPINPRIIRHWWQRISDLAVQRGIDLQNPDSRQLQPLIRQVAIEILREQPEANQIVLGGRTFRDFPNDEYVSKEAYLRQHSYNGAWGEDAILFPALYELGYQPGMFLVGFDGSTSVPYEHVHPIATIAIDNYGAASGGFHWSLHGEYTPGDGNCMYHTVAQQVAKDLPHIARYLELNQDIPQIDAQEFIYDVAHLQHQGEEGERTAFRVAHEILEQFSLPELAEVYENLLLTYAQDEYLLKAPDRLLSPRDNTPQEIAIGKFLISLLSDEDHRIPEDAESELIEDATAKLIEILAKECNKNLDALDYLVQIRKLHPDEIAHATTRAADTVAVSETTEEPQQALVLHDTQELRQQVIQLEQEYDDSPDKTAAIWTILQKIEANEEQRYDAAYTILEKYKIPALVVLYNAARQLPDGDAYLKQAPLDLEPQHVAQFLTSLLQFDKLPAQLDFDKAVELVDNIWCNTNFPTDIAPIKIKQDIHQSLVHMLSKEYWRNPEVLSQVNANLAQITPSRTCAQEAAPLPQDYSPRLTLGEA